MKCVYFLMYFLAGDLRAGDLLAGDLLAGDLRAGDLFGVLRTGDFFGDLTFLGEVILFGDLCPGAFEITPFLTRT